VEIISAKGDKYARAQPYAGAWNAGRVLLPSPKFREEADDRGQDHLWQWADPYVSEHVNFTGQKHGEVDDQVDAGAAMHDAARPLNFTGPTQPVSRFTWGGRR
jgi:phage terminase large subunit-like protein